MKHAMDTLGVGPFAASAVLALSLAGCGGAEASATDESAHAPPLSSEAGVDGSAGDGTVEAAPDVHAEGPFVPSVTPETSPECPTLQPCKDSTEPFDLVYETPANLELREARGRFVLAFDADAQGFVVYEADRATADPDRLELSERVHLDSRYDRVHVDRTNQALACEGGACDLVTFEYGGDVSTVHVPDELHAVTFALGCVAGTGLACLDEATKTWAWRLPPGALEQPIVAFAHLGGEAFVASDGQGAPFILDQGHVTPLDVGTSEPVVSLSTGWRQERQWWVGRTVSGRLVVGSYLGAALCDAGVELATVEAYGSLYVKRGEELAATYWSCERSNLPANMTGFGVTTCGLSSIPFVFDAHRVYATPYECVMD